jgi:hypothetical protein
MVLITFVLLVPQGILPAGRQVMARWQGRRSRQSLEPVGDDASERV